MPTVPFLDRKGSVKATTASIPSPRLSNAGTSRPSEILISRLQQYKHIVKALIAYTQGMADIESSTAKHLKSMDTALASVVPLQESHQFVGKQHGGKSLAGLLENMKNRTVTVEQKHTDLANQIESSGVKPLKALRLEIKERIKELETGLGTLEVGITKERSLTAQAILALSHGLMTRSNTPLDLPAEQDPYLLNVTANQQMVAQINKENNLIRHTILAQDQQGPFETRIITTIQTAYKSISSWSNQARSSISLDWDQIASSMVSFNPVAEWNSFAIQSNKLFDPKTPLRDPNKVDYAGHDDPATRSIRNGTLERKHRYSRTFKKGVYVLTASGYLHEVSDASAPSLSLFIPDCTLGPQPSSDAKNGASFWIEGSKSTSGIKKRMGSLRMGSNKDRSFILKASSHDEAVAWWEDINRFAKMTLQNRNLNNGPVAQAVQHAGLDASTDIIESGSVASEGRDYNGARHVNEKGLPNNAIAPENPLVNASKEDPPPAEHQHLPVPTRRVEDQPMSSPMDSENRPLLPEDKRAKKVRWGGIKLVKRSPTRKAAATKLK